MRPRMRILRLKNSCVRGIVIGNLADRISPAQFSNPPFGICARVVPENIARETNVIAENPFFVAKFILHPPYVSCDAL